MYFETILRKAIQLGASDLHLVPGANPTARISGSLVIIEDSKILLEDIEIAIDRLLSRADKTYLENNGDVQTSYPSIFGRCRVNFFKVRRGYSVTLRIIGAEIPTIEQLGLPSGVEELCHIHKGLIIVTGPTGSGKSTTLAALIDKINSTRAAHIITIESSVEYIHRHKKSIINQREFPNSSQGFSSAIRSSLRQNPDIIMINELNDCEAIREALIAAEAGHLVLSSMNTSCPVNAIESIINSFPEHQQAIIRFKLSMVIEGIISQQLLPRSNEDGLEPVYELVKITPSIRNLVSEGKTQLIRSQIQTEGGIVAIDRAILKLYRNKKISKKTAIEHFQNKEAAIIEIDGSKNFA